METFEIQITRGMTALGLEPSADVVGLLALHARAVLEVNAVMNLTSIPESDFVTLHVLDSLTALPYLNAEGDGSFADIGSGAGYPGIPLAIASGRPVALVESVRKKAAFLESVSATLRLEATVHPVRAEELASEHGEEFQAVVARALSALPSLVELAAPLLAPGGALICMKGRPEPTEVERGDRAARMCGLSLESTSSVTVPGVEAERTILVYRKLGRPTVKLPRRTGLAQRQPLA
jgi:16S rRNA (guanine527-N7)-methyltransferase